MKQKKDEEKMKKYEGGEVRGRSGGVQMEMKH